MVLVPFSSSCSVSPAPLPHHHRLGDLISYRVQYSSGKQAPVVRTHLTYMPGGVPGWLTRGSGAFRDIYAWVKIKSIRCGTIQASSSDHASGSYEPIGQPFLFS